VKRLSESVRYDPSTTTYDGPAFMYLPAQIASRPPFQRQRMELGAVRSGSSDQCTVLSVSRLMVPMSTPGSGCRVFLAGRLSRFLLTTLEIFLHVEKK